MLSNDRLHGTSMAVGHTGPMNLIEPPRRSRQTRLLLNFEEIENFNPRAGKAEQEQEMSKQIFKSFTMLTLAVGLALAVGVASANGQMTSTRVIADIPFDFIVGGTTLPSGEYTVSAVTSNSDGLRISSRDGKSSAIRLSNLAMDESKKQNARLVFHRYGQQYFLAEVWTGQDYGRKLMESKRERSLRRELGSIASKSETSQTVEIVARFR